jgi:hypothetical protein
MLMHNMQNTDRFNKIHTEYTEFYIQYELAKKQLEQDYIKPYYPHKNRFQWNLDFQTKEIIVNE